MLGLLPFALIAVGSSHGLVSELHRMKSPQALQRFAKTIAAKSSDDELDFLATALKPHGTVTPKAMLLLEEVYSRDPRRLQFGGETYCYELNNSFACSACAGCSWFPGSDWMEPHCMEEECAYYQTETDCCTNEGQVESGCFWNARAQKCTAMKCGDDWDTGGITDGACEGVFEDGQDPSWPWPKINKSCDNAAEICRSVEGCHMTCMGCDDAKDSCSRGSAGSEISCSCSNTELGEAFSSMMSCPPFICATCLRGGFFSDEVPSREQMQKRLAEECNEDCHAGTVDCTDEAECLLAWMEQEQKEDQGSTDSADLSCPKHDGVKPSCLTQMPASAPVVFSCDDWHANFTTSCETCGKMLSLSCRSAKQAVIFVMLGAFASALGI